MALDCFETGWFVHEWRDLLYFDCKDLPFQQQTTSDSRSTAVHMASGNAWLRRGKRFKRFIVEIISTLNSRVAIGSGLGWDQSVLIRTVLQIGNGWHCGRKSQHDKDKTRRTVPFELIYQRIASEPL